MTGPAERSYQEELERQRQARSAFIRSAVIHEPPATRKVRKLPADTEQLTLGGTVHTVPAGGVERFIREETARRHPAPPKPEVTPFETWFRQNSEERRVRRGWFMSEDHGLYNGADSLDEAYLTRVRYLMENFMEKD